MQKKIYKNYLGLLKMLIEKGVTKITFNSCVDDATQK